MIINSDVQIFQIYGHTTRIPDFRLIGPSENWLKSDAVVPLPDFFESADFFEPISRKSGSVNTKIGKSVNPNFGTIKIGRVCHVRLKPNFGGTDNPKIGKSGSVTVDFEYLYIRIYYLDHNM